MSFERLEMVVLKVDLPGEGLRSGDIGAVVHVHRPDAAEVEFVSGDGHTRALVTMTADQVRAIGASDMLAVRPAEPASAA